MIPLKGKILQRPVNSNSLNKFTDMQNLFKYKSTKAATKASLCYLLSAPNNAI